MIHTIRNTHRVPPHRPAGGFRLKLLLALALRACPFALTPLQAGQMLFDFGAPDSPTQPGGGGPAVSWNNVTTVGTDPAGMLFDLVDTGGNVTPLFLQMVARFNGANENGTQTSTLHPPSATADSLYGNTEEWNGLTDIQPEFRLSGLTAGATYNLVFYASRTGVTDSRETRYTVTGGNSAVVDYEPANNVDATASATGITPDVLGEITVRLEPGPNNNNAYHFTYLGVLRLERVGGEAWLFDFGSGNSITATQEPDPGAQWNNVPTSVGVDPAGSVPDLVDTAGTPTGATLQMVARFNGANLNGSTAATVYPVSATRDSLFGNTETFNGLANILPVFKLTGLDPDALYDFTFYGSRTGVSDRRETRYTVSGATAAHGDLDASNNVDATVQVLDVRPDASGAITVSLTPGPNNNNGSHFTYLGVMQVDWTRAFTPRILVDLGAATTPTATTAEGDQWNNVTPAVGSSDTGLLENLVTVDGTPTVIDWQMTSRFNGANENGTQEPAPYPVNATRDSLYGNTEVWSGLENVFPAFKLTGLNPATAYDLTFYASRTGVGDNRETRYTITGAAEVTADLNASANLDQTVSVPDVKPDAGGEIRIALAPGPNNDNAYHFTYLGVLQIDWEAPVVPAPATLSEPHYAAGVFRFRLTGTAGASYQVQGASSPGSWTAVRTVALAGDSQVVEVDATGPWQYYRAVGQ